MDENDCSYAVRYDFVGEELCDDWDDEPEEQEFDCGWVDDDIGCSMSGTEDCDFECPYSDSYHNRRSKSDRACG